MKLPASTVRHIAMGITAGTLVGLLAAGCGSGDSLDLTQDERTAALEAKVAALESEAATSTTIETTTTTTTTTTAPPTTTTTARTVVTTPTTKPPVKTLDPATVATAAPWCAARAMVATVTKGMSQTVLITSNLPSKVATVSLNSHQSVTTDPGGNASYSFSAPGGQITATMGQVLPKTNTVRVVFYAQPPTLNQLIDGPRPPVLAQCETQFVSVGP